jgi:hypothetical protein
MSRAGRIASIGVGLSIGLVAGRARADGPSAPGFVMLDREDDGSRVGAEMSYIDLTNGDGTLLRGDVHAQYVDAGSRFGGYAVAPLSHLSSNGMTVTGVGDVELGGIYAASLGEGVGLIAHAGVALPTGSGSSSNGGDLANEISAVSRLNDFYLSLPEGTIIRAGISPVLRSGPWFARADVALELPLHAENDSSPVKGGHFDAGLGYDAGPVAAMIETSNLMLYCSDCGTTNHTVLFDTMALSVRATGSIQPYAALVIPLDDDAKDLISQQQVVTAAITIGVDVPLGRR